MVAEHDTRNRQAIRQCHLEGIVFDLTGDRADDAQSCPCIVGTGGENQCGSSSRLLASRGYRTALTVSTFNKVNG